MNVQVAKRLSKEKRETIDLIAKVLLKDSYPSLTKRQSELSYSFEILLWVERHDVYI